MSPLVEGLPPFGRGVNSRQTRCTGDTDWVSGSTEVAHYLPLALTLRHSLGKVGTGARPCVIVLLRCDDFGCRC